MATTTEMLLEAPLGARALPRGVEFRVWAPEARTMDVVLEHPGRPPAAAPLRREPRGYFSAVVPEARTGDRYRYRVDGRGPYPDPASRFQPEGVHGPSQVVDPEAFRWTDRGWAGAPENLSFYELHVGAFTPEGTFRAAIEKLPLVAELGVAAIELMPAADFAGERNWGYDGVAPYAPSRRYGTPEDLRALVDAAHARGLAVFLDVVYNHLGPDGNYTGAFSSHYFTSAHRSPWGDGVNLDRPRSAEVRRFFIENAAHWIREYRLDGLRLDATHAIVDESPRHFLAELAAAARAAALPGRRVAVVAEDDRNLARLVRPESAGGLGLDAVWADDFHHQTRRLLAGDRDGYYADFEDRIEDLASILRHGWLFTGETSRRACAARGTPTDGVERERFVFCLQNHDQIGNRAHGDRLHHGIDAASYRAAAVLLLTAPQTPLLFMGQEWGASSPFQYFTDHEAGLGRAVTEGRRKEFEGFASFSDPAKRDAIPDPQAPETFRRSVLDWSERREPEHAALLSLHRELFRLRRSMEPSAGIPWVRAFPDGNGLALIREGRERSFLIVVQLRGEGRVDLGALDLPRPRARWEISLTTEDELFCPDPRPAALRLDGPRPEAVFRRAGAIVLEEAR